MILLRTRIVCTVCVLGGLLAMFGLPAMAQATAFDEPAFVPSPSSWTTNFGVQQQDKKVGVFSADVTGDGLADAVRVVNGTWYVAPSTGTGFTVQATAWATGLGVPVTGSSHINTYLVADATGDGKADAIAAIDGTWYVGRSTGTSFTKDATPWATNFGVWVQDKTIGLLAGDVTGDGKADAIRVVNGVWSVGSSNGSNFTVLATPWANGLGVPVGTGSSHQNSYFAADVTGDGKADAIAAIDGTWSVGRSSGTSFLVDPLPWATGFGSWESPVVVGDINDDGKADAIKVASGTWSVAASSGNAFSPQGTAWASGLGIPVGGTGHINAYMAADATGDGKADAIAAIDGSWSVGAAELVRDRITAAGSGWSVKFADEFSGTSGGVGLDGSKWNTQRDDYVDHGAHRVGGHPYNYMEAADYSTSNVSVGGGILSEVIHQDPLPYAYSTGMVNSKGHFSFTYGYLEARINAPFCSGCWGAFWMLPANDAWPPELDVAEFADFTYTKRPIFASHASSGSSVQSAIPNDLSAEPHDYGLLWTPDYVRVFVDGMPGPKYTGTAVPNQLMYIILSNQVCTRYGAEDPLAPTGDCPINGPSGGETMTVDWVHVYGSAITQVG